MDSKSKRKYLIRNPLPKKKFSLKICYSGEVRAIEICHCGAVPDTKEKKYQYYVGGETTWVDNLDSNKANMEMLEEIAVELGFENPKFSYRYLRRLCISELKDDGDVRKMIGELSSSQELEVYLDGDKEEIQIEEYPKMLLWNCRGLNNPTLEMLTALVNIYNPEIVSLIETKLSSEFMANVSFKLGFQNFRDSPTNRHMEDLNNCVGLAVLWKTNVKLEFYNRSENFLDFLVDEKWRLSVFYGDPKKKKNSWLWLKELSDNSPNQNGPWIVTADFNEVLEIKEKIGGREKTTTEIKPFEEALECCALKDLDFEGNPFTWTGHDGIKERLDRGVATTDWIDLFQNSRVTNFTNCIFSDHSPILIETNSQKQRLKATKSLSLTMKKFLDFVVVMEEEYYKVKIQTPKEFVKVNVKIKDVYYDLAKHVVPHLFQVKFIAVQEKSDDECQVTYERKVTLLTCHNLRALLLNYMVILKPREEYDIENLVDFPSISSKKSKKRISDYSEYLAQAMNLIKLIPPEGKVREEIVRERSNEQLENLIQWVKEVTPGSDYSSMKEKLKEKKSLAVTIGRAIVLYNTIVSMIGEKQIEREGKITELEEKLGIHCKYYYGGISANATVRAREHQMTSTSLKYLLKNLGWGLSNDNCAYKITEINDQQLSKLEEDMIRAERDAAILEHDPWVEKIMENGINEKKLLKLVDTGIIDGQLKVLQDIGSISYLKNGKIALSNSDKNVDSIIGRLKKALCDALKTLKAKKNMSTVAFLKRLKEAYRASKKIT